MSKLVLHTLAFLLSPAAAGSENEILVQRDLREKAERFVSQVQTPDQNDEPMARFTDPLCVGSAGLPKEAGQAIVDRVSNTALSVGLKIGPPGCPPNIMIVFVDGIREAVKQVHSTGSRSIASQAKADVKRIVSEKGDAISWIEVATKSTLGEKPYTVPNDPAILNVWTSSNLSMPIRRDILSATVLIELKAVPGRSLLQIADYAAMRALTGAKGRGGLGSQSVLSAFTPDGDATAARELTKQDRGYLLGLYKGRSDLKPVMKRQYITSEIAGADLEK